MTDLAIGLVGCGRLAELGYLPALRAARGVRLVAVADPDPGRRTHLAGLAREGGHPVRTGAHASDLLDMPLDGVVLATPATVHLADATLAADAGVPALVEKPPAPDAATAARLAALTPSPRLGFNRRFDPRTARLREVARAAGWVDVEIVLHYRRRSWRAHTIADDALLDLGPHVIDLARWITESDVTAVTADAVTDRAAVLDLALTHGRARVACATDQPHREQVVLRAAGGRELVDDRVGGLVAGLRARVTGRGRPHPLAASLTAQVEAWATVLRGGADPTLGTGHDGVAVMAAVDAARASARSGGAPTPVPTTTTPRPA